MNVKVCGIVHQANHDALSTCAIDMVGINLYPSSKRYIGSKEISVIDGQERIGVFVNASMKDIEQAVNQHRLDYAQLHGDENIETCKKIQQLIPIIKVFRITEEFDWTITEKYEFADRYLFDTYTKGYGGSGKRFDWSQLHRYRGKVPFLLSGGIGPGDVEEIRQINHPAFTGVDINSGFEDEPGLKNIEKIRSFIQAIKN